MRGYLRGGREGIRGGIREGGREGIRGGIREGGRGGIRGGIREGAKRAGDVYEFVHTEKTQSIITMRFNGDKIN